MADLFTFYEFHLSILNSVIVVYLSIFISYFLSRFLVRSLYYNKIFKMVIRSIRNYFLVFVPFLILLYLLLVPDGYLSKFIFIFLGTQIYFLASIGGYIEYVPEQYFNSIFSLGADKNFVRSEVVWKSILPFVFNIIICANFYIWLTIIAFEYVSGQSGVGEALRGIFLSGDLVLTLLAALITITIILLFALFIKFLKEKIIFWNPDF